MSPWRTLNLVVLGVASAGVIWLVRHHQWLYAGLLALAAFIGWPRGLVWFFGEDITQPRPAPPPIKKETNNEKMK
jgi:hypothetical protein